MTLALLLLAPLLVQDEVPERNQKPQPESRVETRRIELEISPGSVVLKAHESDTEKVETWKAASPEEFKEKYPEVVKEYNLEPLLTPQEGAPSGTDELDRTMRDALRDFTEAWRREEGRAQDGKPRFGLLVTAVPAALSSQLKLKEGEGVLVVDVYEKSLASKAGLQRHDLVLELDGRAVKEVGEFTNEIKSALGKKDFTLTIMREGKKSEIEVKADKKD